MCELVCIYCDHLCVHHGPGSASVVCSCGLRLRMGHLLISVFAGACLGAPQSSGVRRGPVPLPTLGRGHSCGTCQCLCSSSALPAPAAARLPLPTKFWPGVLQAGGGVCGDEMGHRSLLGHTGGSDTWEDGTAMSGDPEQ